MTDLILLRDWQASQIEFWLPTKYPGYDVSSFGRVRSWWQRQALGCYGSRTFIGITPYYLKPIYQSGGYRAVAVARNAKGRPKYVSLHRLVAKSFIPEVDGLPHINHCNCIKTDCRSDNLEWTVPKKNTQHGIDAGVIKVIGSANPMAKLAEADVHKIKTLRFLGMSRRAVANLLNIRYSHVWSIDHGKIWKSVQLESPFHF